MVGNVVLNKVGGKSSPENSGTHAWRFVGSTRSTDIWFAGSESETLDFVRRHLCERFVKKLDAGKVGG